MASGSRFGFQELLFGFVAGGPRFLTGPDVGYLEEKRYYGVVDGHGRMCGRGHG